jgi:uncharacterized protein (TIGR02145 family)
VSKDSIATEVGVHTASFSITNTSSEENFTWQVKKGNYPWLSIDHTAGSEPLRPGQSVAITITIDPALLVGGSNRGVLNITTDKGDYKDVPVIALGRVHPTVIVHDAEVDGVNYTAMLNAEVTEIGTPAYNRRGFCYSSSNDNPRIGAANTTVQTVSGTAIGGTYQWEMSGLQLENTYYVQAFVMVAGVDTVYSSRAATFSFVSTMPTPGSVSVSLVASTTVSVSASITAVGIPAYTVRGVCYGTSANPTVGNSKQEVTGTGTGSYSAALSGLTANTTYYIRAYATNAVGTEYGTVSSFTTNAKPTDGGGNAYEAITIGNQVWLQQNLRAAKYNDGTAITVMATASTWKGATTAYYCWHDNNSANAAQYGALYNYYVVASTKNVCPSGYHIPAKAEWEQLATYLGGASVAGAKLKSNISWDGTNTSGFNATAGGYRNSTDGAFYALGIEGGWWTTNTVSPTGEAYYMDLYQGYNDITSLSANRKNGMSIRCIKTP